MNIMIKPPATPEPPAAIAPRRAGGHDAPATARPRGRARLAPWQVSVATYMMAGQMDGTMSLIVVARALDMSLGHFIKAFANSVGDTPYQWFQKQRIDRARELLHSPGLSLAAIGAACGFADQSHFTRCFTRAMGITPGMWRRDPLNLAVRRRTAPDPCGIR